VFRRWLMLQRDGPDLLGATALDGAVVQALERCDCDLHRRDTGLVSLPPNDAVRARWRTQARLNPGETRV
jgi:hypothetical protein